MHTSFLVKDNITDVEEEGLAQTQDVQEHSKLCLPETQHASAVLLLLRNNEFTQNNIKKQRQRQKPIQKQETTLEHSGLQGQTECDPRRCHLLGLREASCLPHLGPESKPLFSKEALKRCPGINLSVARGFSAAVSHSRSQTGASMGVSRSCLNSGEPEKLNFCQCQEKGEPDYLLFVTT